MERNRKVHQIVQVNDNKKQTNYKESKKPLIEP